MLRSLLVIGIVVAFIACAFIPPTASNYQAVAKAAHNQISERTVAVLRGKVASTPDAGTALELLKKVVPKPKAALKVAAKRVQIAVTGQSPSTAWNTAKGSPDPVFVEQLERIEWAMKKHDVRLCKDVRREAVGGQPRDYLALCLARVTDDASRCKQIDPVEAPLLKHLCDEELAT